MVSTSVNTPAAGVERCVSCDAPLSGPYCSRCGERTLEPEDLTLRHFMAHTVADELLSVDSSLWRTLRLLFARPGALSLEYAAGRRRPYVNPFRLLLIAIVAYLLMTASGFNVFWNLGPVQANISPVVASPSGSVEGTIVKVDRYGVLRRQVAAKRERLASAAGRDRFHDRLAAFVQPLSFTNVLFLAAVLQLVFRWRRRRFLEHLAFSMHVISFVLLSTPIILIAFVIDAGMSVFLLFMAGVALWQFVYLAIAIRRFYLAGNPWTGRLVSLAAAMLVYVLNTVFMNAVQLAGAAIALAMA